jgi:hypothetical protein
MQTTSKPITHTAEPTPTARFLAIIDRTATPAISIPPAWSIGPMAGNA